MLEQETEQLHQDRERIEEKDSDAALSTADPAILGSADNVTERSAPARESTEYAAATNQAPNTNRMLQEFVGVEIVPAP